MGAMHRLTRALVVAALAGGTVSALPLAAHPAAADEVFSGGVDLPTDYIAPSDAEARSTTTTTYPTSVDLTPWTVPVGNQGQVQSCVSWAISYGMLGWYSRHEGRAGQPFSPMYTYSQTNGGQNQPSRPNDVLNLLRTQGVDTEAHYAPASTNWWTLPTSAERANAQRWRISGFRTLFSGQSGFGSSGATGIKKALAGSKPVAILLPARSGFKSLGASASAVDNDTTSGYTFLHEVLAVGYNSSGVLIQNSWGTGWANAGFGRISWNVIGADVVRADTINSFGRPHDLSSDGKADIVAIRQDGTLWRYNGTGTGGFSGMQVGDSAGWTFFDGLEATTDLNGDGFNDLIGRSAATKELYYYQGDGTGEFPRYVDLGSGFSDLDTLVASGDVTRDGKADLIGRTPDGQLWLYRGNGAGGFAGRTVISAGWGIFDTLLGVGDWNSDGLNDLAARRTDGTLWLYRGTGAGTFQTAVQIGHGWQGFTALVAPGDITGDGAPDLLARTSTGYLLRYPGNGATGFGTSSTVGGGWNTMVSIG